MMGSKHELVKPEPPYVHEQPWLCLLYLKLRVAQNCLVSMIKDSANKQRQDVHYSPFTNCSTVYGTPYVSLFVPTVILYLHKVSLDFLSDCCVAVRCATEAFSTTCAVHAG